MDMVEAISKEQKEQASSVLKGNGVKRAAFFGSFARGQATEGSDIDILVEFEGEKSLFDIGGLKMELEDIFNKKIDIVEYQSLHPLLREDILKEQVSIL
ncbi:MAG: nucleotidyltransferase family protein [Candidatus Paceibacterota bacterium]|jgi:hypothetical protein